MTIYLVLIGNQSRYFFNTPFFIFKQNQENFTVAEGSWKISGASGKRGGWIHKKSSWKHRERLAYDWFLFLDYVKEDTNRYLFTLAMTYPRNSFTHLVGEPMSLFGILRRTWVVQGTLHLPHVRPTSAWAVTPNPDVPNLRSAHPERSSLLLSQPWRQDFESFLFWNLLGLVIFFVSWVWELHSSLRREYFP